MAQILVRNIEDSVKVRLQRRARLNGRSMEAEVREILRDTVGEKRNGSEVGFGTASAALFRECPLEEPIKELRFRMEIPTFDFDGEE